MNSVIDLDIINNNNFDYSILDGNTSEELQKIATEISAISSNTKYLIGEKLAKAQELLSKNGYGCFSEWIESYGLKRRTAYNCIDYYKVFVQNLHKQKELEKLSDTKIYELAKLQSQQQKEVLENVDLESKTVQEVKELTKQIKAEQEYSNELQEAIRDKERKIQNLENEIKNVQPEIIEKEIVKEIIPTELLEEKEKLENEIKELKKRAEKAEDTIKNIRLESKIEKDHLYNSANLDELLQNVKDFLAKNSKFTYLKEDLQNIPAKKKKFIEQSVNSMEEWTMLMKQALDNRQDVVGNIIYGEGEIINE